MFLFAGACFFLAFVVRMRSGAWIKATVLYVRSNGADGGRAKMEAAFIAKSEDGKHLLLTTKKDRMCDGKTACRSARSKWPDGVWYAPMRAPP